MLKAHPGTASQRSRRTGAALVALLTALSISACEEDVDSTPESGADTPHDEEDGGTRPLDGGRDASMDAAVDGGFIDGGRDASIDSATEEPSGADATVVDQALAAFRALEADAGTTYWYDEENCLINSDTGTITRVQVEGQVARLVGRTTIDQTDCERIVNRYGTFTPELLPELYDRCREVIATGTGRTQISVDPAGFLRSCFYATAPDCLDNCGAGYHLRSLTFGQAPAFTDAGVAPDASLPDAS